MKTHLDIKVDKKQVLELLDCKETSPHYRMYTSLYDEIMEENIGDFQPIGYYIFKDNLSYTKENCEQVVLCIVTLGKTVDENIKKYFDEAEYLKGMMLSGIADHLLFECSNQLYKKISSETKNYGQNLTQRIEPGSTQADITMQKVILEEINEKEKTGIDITSGYMLDPTKSMAYFYGVGENIEYTSIDHDCSLCDNFDCSHREYPITIRNENSEYTIPAKKGQNLLAVLQENNVPIEATCNGTKKCGKCKVRVVDPLIERSETEINFLSEDEIESGIILACFHVVEQPLILEIKDDKGKGSKILSTFHIKSIQQAKYKVVAIDKVDDLTEGNTSVTDRINSTLYSKYQFSLEAIRQLSQFESLNTPLYCLVVNDREVVKVQTNEFHDVYGVAIDIGTTTIAIALIDLLKGRMVDIYKNSNPQKSYGADVISRILYASQDDKGTLTKSIQTELEKGFLQLIEKNDLKSNDLYEIAIAGNTTMQYLLLGINPYKLSMSPFLTIDLNMVCTSYQSMFKDLDIHCKVYALPGISAYVGADILSGFYYSDFQDQEGIHLFIDIGTNGEIALKIKDKIICVATAAGPAFEGANIRCGMGSLEGAICNVIYENGAYQYEVLGTEQPSGICGSGIIDLVAEAVKKGDVDTTGRIVHEDGSIILYKSEKREIGIYQQDIRQVQLAKAAIAAGIEVLIDEGGCSMGDIDTVFLAGGFGSHMNTENAVKIGLLPKALQNKTQIIGNSSLGGCARFLLESMSENTFDKIKNQCKYVELSTDPRFNNQYIMNMSFE